MYGIGKLSFFFREKRTFSHDDASSYQASFLCKMDYKHDYVPTQDAKGKSWESP